MEWNQALAGMTPAEGLLGAFFQSVTARTAGFNTLPIGMLKNSSCFLLMILMFIGAAPGSCGGGIKVSTLGILFLMVTTRLSGREESHVFHRSIPRETIAKALAIALSAVALVSLMFMGLLLTEEIGLEPGTDRAGFIELAFESISAFGTVGLSMGITPQLSQGGRLLIILLMFIGRLGPLTMAVALRPLKGGTNYRYARGHVMVG
jgi:trk system potassium uptake protein TrkH